MQLPAEVLAVATASVDEGRTFLKRNLRLSDFSDTFQQIFKEEIYSRDRRNAAQLEAIGCFGRN
ncbi:hypothetical protein DO97_19660 [Neosynechococcus sphagnicola sy1]|uniref:Uncharacterized protein n=1 Tax=Neosynechococcus sphagnicola sy1 TaxID=1497020 RepID=A0A098TKS6_9CYAN|nr:hypothetical protein DO97_19660 [Neosynechococcus sphagnicola sy1]